MIFGFISFVVVLCVFFKENTSVKSESRTSETEERQFTSGAEPVNESVGQTDSSVKSFSRKRRGSDTGNSLGKKDSTFSQRLRRQLL